MKKIVGLKELRENVAKYEKMVQRGDSLIVLRKSKPVFKITPVEDSGQWEEVIDFTKLKRGGIKIDEIIARL